MNARLAHYGDRLRGSLWFVPAIMALAAVALAAVTLAIDARVTLQEEGAFPVAYRGGPGGASAVLSTIAGSIIGVTGVTFSITVVALSLASNQFGPRVLRNFLRDRSNQVVLGTFIGTFVFTLLAQRALNPAAGARAVPQITVTVAIGLALASLAVLIYFIHHISISIQADHILANVSAELTESIDRLYPEGMGGASMFPVAAPPPIPERLDEESRLVRATDSGYLQAVDEDHLMRLAVERDVFLRLRYRPGDFVAARTVLLEVWPRPGLDDAFDDAVRDLFILGTGRTAEQDVEFSVLQLAEVATRSLSPGINDPFTASACLDRLGAALCRLAERPLPFPYRHDDEGRLRIVAKRVDFEALVDAAFDSIRRYGSTSAMITLRLLDTLETVASCTTDAGRRHVLMRHVEEAYVASVKADHPEADAKEIRERYERVRSALAAGASGRPPPRSAT